ncbi:glutathione S-transferase [Aspergillus brunneoviolaceus CBS 621.78]|uniref:Glutathione S-transferase n=1 Tax=Aspergillus brunneoviolaceus CBS 621.78 TaxID=1450534 RepID=A0ACD1G6Y5_9EURO|nr:glutathione S-transferase [Aspergillus brunneoviolaceus CBS 621.78]RAH44990.1 glutathione S-transferase [Aspergillus brunneoviolaceus CBS 621.78]
MVLKLHGLAMSTCTKRVQVVLNEKGVDHEFVPIDFAKGEHKSEAYLANLQPFGKVPALEDTETGVKIFESRAIGQYIASRYRGQGNEVSPPESDLKAFALYQQALSVEQSYFDPAVSGIAFEKVFKAYKGLGQTDEGRVQALVAQLDAALQGYERILSKQKYLAGDSVTLADLYHLPYGAFVEPFGFAELLPKYPHTQKWWEELKARESWKKIADAK